MGRINYQLQLRQSSVVVQFKKWPALNKTWQLYLMIMLCLVASLVQSNKNNGMVRICLSLTLPLSLSLFLALFKLGMPGRNHFFIIYVQLYNGHCQKKHARQTQTVKTWNSQVKQAETLRPTAIYSLYLYPTLFFPLGSCISAMTAGSALLFRTTGQFLNSRLFRGFRQRSITREFRWG